MEKGKAPEKHRLQEAIMGYQRIPPKPIFKRFRHDIKLLYQRRLFKSEVGKSNRDIRMRGSCPPRGLKATSTDLSTKGRQGAKGAKGGQQFRGVENERQTTVSSWYKRTADRHRWVIGWFKEVGSRLKRTAGVRHLLLILYLLHFLSFLILHCWQNATAPYLSKCKRHC